jgi:hypothetical protein
MPSSLRDPFLSHLTGFLFATISRNYSGYYVLNLARNHTVMHLFSSLITPYRYSYIPMTGPNMVVDDLPNQRGGMTFLRQRVLYFNTKI